jgi:hypothetical protein
MRKVVLLLVGVSALGIPSTLLTAAQMQNSETHLMKTRQKEERKALKLKEYNQRAYYKDPHIPKALREQRKHEMLRERRALRDRQKAELQDLKDRRKIYKEGMKGMSGQ